MTWTRVAATRIQADRATVYNLLAEVELWPALLPHIRSLRVLRREGRRRLVAVRASWRGLPLGYTAVVTVDPARSSMTLRHLSRLTRGSVATWTVHPAPSTGGPADGVELTVRQHVVVPLPLVGPLLAEAFVGGRVARELGPAMLDRIKEIAEGGSLAGRG